MQAMKAVEIAHALYRAHGDKAEWEAAQKERQYKSAGKNNEAAHWRAIRGNIRQMRGAIQG
jgi:hypothetical protein